LSLPELRDWLLFEEEFGPLTLHERIDAMSAHVAYVVHATAGGKLRPQDFVRRWEVRKPLDDDGVVSYLHAMARR
jgi:hypothetical protein